MRLTTIKLLGAAGRMFGRVHRLAVSSPAEAVRALCTIHPGFQAWVLEQHDRGVAWRVVTDSPCGLPAEELQRQTSSDTIIFAPVLQGAGGGAGGVLQIVLGVALIALAFVSFGTTALAGVLSGGVGSIGMGFIGVGLLLGGIAGLITPTPQKPKDALQSNLFTRNSNDGGFGEVVPVLYGQRRVRSPRVISFDLSIAGDREIDSRKSVGLLGYVARKNLEADFPPDTPPTPTPAITFTTQPANVSVTAPSGATFTAVATANDAGNLSYQWEVSTDNGAIYTRITNTGMYSGALTTTLSISDSTGLDGRMYRIVVSSTGGAPSATSTSGTLVVTPEPWSGNFSDWTVQNYGWPDTISLDWWGT
jgi:predicted phage tail protein